ncbi:MAG TPA: EMC3/TMCO1 family protein [Bacillota bacterium]|nr:EMC3/TMCO1 family protein [Bacillota bacterium]
MNKEGSFKGIFIVMLLALLIAFFWEKVSWIRDAANFILNPTAGALLNWNVTIGMTLLVILIAILMTLVQKYGTDQKTLGEMKKEQKEVQEEIKKAKEHPEKMMELQKKQFAFLPKMMKLSMRPIIYTSIPLILFFRWFMDFFAAAGNIKFFGFLNWFWFYLLGSMIFSSILRKIFKVV